MEKVNLKILDDLGIKFLKPKKINSVHDIKHNDIIVNLNGFCQLVPASLHVVYDIKYKCYLIIRTDTENIKNWPINDSIVWNSVSRRTFGFSMYHQKSKHLYPIIASNSRSFNNKISTIYDICFRVPIIRLKKSSHVFSTKDTL